LRPSPEGASLDHAQLQGASLDFAKLQGASLDLAQLQGASLKEARLFGASLNEAQLQGASLDDAQLQGAALKDAELQSGSLDRARLQGAWLDGAHLQGASLYAANLQGASLKKVFAWRTDARNANWQDTFVVGAETSPVGWAAESFNKLKQLVAEQLPEGDKRRGAMERIMSRLDPAKGLEKENEMGNVWEAQARSSPIPEIYEKRLAKLWQEIGCEADGAPYVLSRTARSLDGHVSSLCRAKPTAARARKSLPRRGALPRRARSHRGREGKAQRNPRPPSAARAEARHDIAFWRTKLKRLGQGD
jgi:hypothetical protein